MQKSHQKYILSTSEYIALSCFQVLFVISMATATFYHCHHTHRKSNLLVRGTKRHIFQKAIQLKSFCTLIEGTFKHVK